MTALPTTPSFMDYEAVYLPKNHFIKAETMEMCIRDSLRVEQAIQKLQPENRLWGVGVVGHGETVADDFRLSLRKGSVQKKCAIGKMNPIRLRGKILRQRRQLHQLHDVADFAGNVADRTAFQLLKNLSPQISFRGSVVVFVCLKLPSSNGFRVPV